MSQKGPTVMCHPPQKGTEVGPRPEVLLRWGVSRTLRVSRWRGSALSLWPSRWYEVQDKVPEDRRVQ